MKSIDELLRMETSERAYYLYNEALKLGKRLNPTYEKFIKLDPYWATFYALAIIKERWLEAEKIIMSCKWCATQYAQLLRKDKNEKSEKRITGIS